MAEYARRIGSGDGIGVGGGALFHPTRFSCLRTGRLCLLEIDPFHHRQALQVTSQAVQAHFDGAEADPFAAAEDAGAAYDHFVAGGDRGP